MWHQKRRRRLGLETEHRISLIRNLAKELVSQERIVTTHARAKEAQRFTEKLITLAKKNTLHARRLIIAELGSGSEAIAKRLMEIIAPKFSERKGGYTRVIRYQFRKGDGAQLVILEFSAPVSEPKEKKVKKIKQKTDKPETKAAKPHVEKETEKKDAPRIKSSEKTSESKGSEKESQKKGGFLSNLRRFLTGKDEQ